MGILKNCWHGGLEEEAGRSPFSGNGLEGALTEQNQWQLQQRGSGGGKGGNAMNFNQLTRTNSKVILHEDQGGCCGVAGLGEGLKARG